MRRLLLAISMLLGGCATTALSPEQQGEIVKEVREGGPDRYLALSFYVTPFFGDVGKKLLTPVPPDEVFLLNQPTGAPVNPGKIERILPVGTKMRVLLVEFPTLWALVERVPYTPRHLPWVYLRISGAPESSLPYILPIRGVNDSRARFMAEFERFLTLDDPGPKISAMAEPFRTSVRTKTAEPEMPIDALVMALGYPDRIVVRFVGPVRREEWHYPDSKRVALIDDGKFVEFLPPPAQTPSGP
jgi:hypothetical protein